MLACRWFCFVGMLLAALIPAGCEDDFPLPDKPPPPASQPVPPVAVVVQRGTTFPPPHDGQLIAIPDEKGYVEWDYRTGCLFLLGPGGESLAGVEDVTVYMSLPAGPYRLALATSGEPAYPTSYRAESDGSDLLRRSDLTGVLRFTLNGEPCRVLLKIPPPASLPADTNDPSRIET